MVATGSGDSTLRLWSLEDGSALRTFQGHGASVLRVSFLAGGLQVTTPSTDLSECTRYTACAVTVGGKLLIGSRLAQRYLAWMCNSGCIITAFLVPSVMKGT